MQQTSSQYAPRTRHAYFVFNMMSLRSRFCLQSQRAKYDEEFTQTMRSLLECKNFVAGGQSFGLGDSWHRSINADRAQHSHSNGERANVLLKFFCWPRQCRDCCVAACRNLVFFVQRVSQHVQLILFFSLTLPARNNHLLPEVAQRFILTSIKRPKRTPSRSAAGPPSPDPTSQDHSPCDQGLTSPLQTSNLSQTPCRRPDKKPSIAAEGIETEDIQNSTNVTSAHAT